MMAIGFLLGVGSTLAFGLICAVLVAASLPSRTRPLGIPPAPRASKRTIKGSPEWLIAARALGMTPDGRIDPRPYIPHTFDQEG